MSVREGVRGREGWGFVIITQGVLIGTLVKNTKLQGRKWLFQILMCCLGIERFILNLLKNGGKQ